MDTIPNSAVLIANSRIIKKLGILDLKYYLEIEKKVKEVFGWN